MKLVGNYNSPFVRRVAISLSALAMPFELQVLIVSKQPEKVQEFNPVVRIRRLSSMTEKSLSTAPPS